ncbi:hypothetical protein OA77_01155 [Pseudomonas coronafaciens]|nr:hypothetical protein OA77_01155 [Pseudomonas coronafaciens]
MACSGCDARREWIKKWSKVAYERAQQLIAKPDHGRADEADRTVNADGEPPEQDAPATGRKRPADGSRSGRSKAGADVP